MTDRLKNRVAVITGSGGGVGRAVALLMASEGASIVVNDLGRHTDGEYLADKVVREINEGGGKAAASYDSVATMAGGTNIINSAIKNFGRIDILVNNAGNFVKASTVDLTEAQWDAIITVHMKGHFACAQPAIREMVKQKHGRIINVSSMAAARGIGVAYCSAKAGILGFTTSLATELKDYGITVNAVLPSAVTNLFPDKIASMPGLPPQKRLGPEYAAPIFAYLATDEAKDVTGRFFKMGNGDFIVYPVPLSVPSGTATPVYKDGVWTVEELIRVVPALL
jgi:NAD(P)-dependent dehydrogenase (short-subunit alcohol dehydrogenase family)